MPVTTNKPPATKPAEPTPPAPDPTPPAPDPTPAPAKDPRAKNLEVLDPAREAELELLRREKDRLVELIGSADVDELVMLRAEVASLSQVAARSGRLTGPKHMSEGVREEVERVGYSNDPFTGRPVTREDLP
jgi:hypothetical protein